jgi:oligoribonuclease
MIAWMDIETSGLEPETGYPLEVALAITNDSFDILARDSWVISWGVPALKSLTSTPVLKMHTESGLWNDVEQSMLPARGVENMMIDLYQSVTNDPWPLAGSSVQFDRMWLRKWFPRFNNLLHYRCIDVSSFKELNNRTHFTTPWQKREAHRAMPDLLESIDELKHYRSAILGVVRA